MTLTFDRPLDLARMRRERHARLVASMQEDGIDALLLLGQANIVYATGVRVPASDQNLAILHDLAALRRIADERHLLLIEDAACAIGSEIQWDGEWQVIGRPHGHIACFSLHPRKVITTGDGGMITTSNAEWDARLRLLRQHGMSISDKARHGATSVMFEEYPIPGFNYRMTDLQAAMGREQLKPLPGIL